MSYELKYVKYKLKYLKLLLNSKFEQKGGADVSWPKSGDTIKVGDLLQIEDLGEFGDAIYNYPIIETYPIGEVSYIDDSKIVFSDLKPLKITDRWRNFSPFGKEFTFESSKHPGATIYFTKINKEEEKVYSPGNISSNSNKFNDKDIERIKEQIRELEVKQKQLERKLNNHYHIMPTSGMKEFEEAHPYYNRKID